MNENLNLVEILKDCPKGTKLYCTIYGEVELDYVDTRSNYPIVIRTEKEERESFTTEGKLRKVYDGECILFPSRDQRDWSKFTNPWYKKDRFDPKTLKAFDRVLTRDSSNAKWSCNLFSHIDKKSESGCPYVCEGFEWRYCIPYNDETKHLLGTSEEAPEYYRYWED